MRDELIYRGTRPPEPDPHWWNSIAATERVTRLVAAAFRGPEARRGRRLLGPDRGPVPAAGRARRLGAGKDFAGLPPARRQLVTNHDAFGWFARDYGFTSIRSAA